MDYKRIDKIFCIILCPLILSSSPSLCSHAHWTPAAEAPDGTSLSPTAPPAGTPGRTAGDAPGAIHPVSGPDPPV